MCWQYLVAVVGVVPDQLRLMRQAAVPDRTFLALNSF
jgi:hypothetical protein